MNLLEDILAGYDMTAENTELAQENANLKEVVAVLNELSEDTIQKLELVKAQNLSLILEVQRLRGLLSIAWDSEERLKTELASHLECSL